MSVGATIPEELVITVKAYDGISIAAAEDGVVAQAAIQAVETRATAQLIGVILA